MKDCPQFKEAMEETFHAFLTQNCVFDCCKSITLSDIDATSWSEIKGNNYMLTMSVNDRQYQMCKFKSREFLRSIEFKDGTNLDNNEIICY